MSPELTTADLTAAAEARRDQRAQQPEARHNDLFSNEQLANLKTRWDQIQGSFVDEPKGAVEKADTLVAEAITNLADAFARTRADLDHQWKQGDSVSTEDLRLALRQYRSFFTRLLEA